MRPLERRVQIGPLLDLGSSISDLARRTHTNPRMWHRWKHEGITVTMADAVAVSLGVHPAELWSDWYEDADAEVVS